MKSDAQFDSVIREFRALRREIRIILALLGLLGALRLLDWLG